MTRCTLSVIELSQCIHDLLFSCVTAIMQYGLKFNSAEPDKKSEIPKAGGTLFRKTLLLGIHLNAHTYLCFQGNIYHIYQSHQAISCCNFPHHCPLKPFSGQLRCCQKTCQSSVSPTHHVMHTNGQMRPVKQCKSMQFYLMFLHLPTDQ